MTITTTFVDNTDKNHTIKGKYSFKSASSATQSMVKNLNGTYDTIINRIGDIDGDEYVYLLFTYIPSTGEYDSPNPGKKMATKFSFAGKLTPLVRN